MKFCGECGARLEDDALFCGECGARQDDMATSYGQDVGQESTPMPQGGPGVRQEGTPMSHSRQGVRQEGAPMSHGGQEAGRESTQHFRTEPSPKKTRSGIQNGGGKKQAPGKINGALIAALCVVVALLLAVIGGGGLYIMKTHREKANVPKVGQDDKLKEQDEDEEQEEQKEEEEKERTDLSEANMNFIGKMNQRYVALDLDFDAVITIGNRNGNLADVNISVLDDTYDITCSGTIMSDSVIQITLDGGEKIRLIWGDENTFTAYPTDGFTYESIQMVRLLCESLNKVVYYAEEEWQPDRTIVYPPEGTYWDGNYPPLYADYYLEVSNVTAEGFDFVIYGRNSKEDEFTIVFKPHTAVYTDTRTAVYFGKKYTLTFQWQQMGYMTVTGFEERIPVGSPPLCNTGYLGVS